METQQRLRELCIALPEVIERPSHGEPTWFVRGKKSFVMYADHHHNDRVAFWCAAADGVQQSMVAAEPGKYFRPPYFGVRGWLGVWLDIDNVEWDEIAQIVEDAYRAVAPKKLVEAISSERAG